MSVFGKIVHLMVCGLALAATTAAAQKATIEEQVNARAERITDAQAFMKEIDQTIDLANSGQYGRIKTRDLDRIAAARDTIASLLEGRTKATELKPEQRLELFNAQELITSIVRNDEKNRKVCQRVQVTGSRVPKSECLTVAEREARAKAASETTARSQRVGCIPGEGNSCS